MEDEDEEKDCIMEDPVVAPLTLQETKLENLLSLPQAGLLSVLQLKVIIRQNFFFRKVPVE